MTLIHWQPFSEMNLLQSDMNRLFDALEPMERESTQQFVPLVEISETADTIYLQVEVPGMNANDLDVRLNEGRGQRAQRHSFCRMQAQRTCPHAG